ncbi:MAG: hypothetical protein J0I79_00925 [Mesorhizobium sp.]|uniref:hypothetical protein n=1 Tax=Mesorhizobium sp. TaxID=1871066 RepID=UPI001AD46D04|nr:hypothetical protein [Mesorhizobium sp.]MBN9216493.1 hypothetical protein [Mesorhizobium sp.]
MSESCPVPTPAERHYIAVQDSAERAMMAAIQRAIDDAAAQAAEALRSSEFRDSPPSRDYLAAVAHQKLFALLCGADPETFVGGNPDIAASILENGRKISDHYWAKDGAQAARPEAEG